MSRLICLLMMTAAPVFAEPPKVVTDIAPVHALVAQVMDGVAMPELIIPPNASPHGYAMRPSEARNLAQADVVVWVGPTLTPWLKGPIDTLGAEAVELVLADVNGITMLPFREGEAFEHHDHDHGNDHADEEDHAEEEGHTEEEGHADEGGHAHDDDHGDEEAHDHDDDHDHGEADDRDDAHKEGSSDPHLWLDPENASIWLTAIATTLATADPENANIYHDNATKGQVAIALQEKAIAAQLAPLAGKPFVVLHDGFHYFEAHFGVEAIAAVSAGDAAKPGAARIASLRAQLADSGVRCAFTEPQINASLLETVTEGLDVKIGILDPLGANLPLGPGHYAALLGAMADSFEDCLGDR